MEFSVVKSDDPFSKLIADLHNDYLLNMANKRYRPAAVLAGAICEVLLYRCEVLLYRLLLESGVSQALLKDDRTLGFNKLFDYIRILRLEQADGFPMSQLVEIQRNRNYAVHAGLMVNKERELRVDDLEVFNPVIKYFGL